MKDKNKETKDRLELVKNVAKILDIDEQLLLDFRPTSIDGEIYKIFDDREKFLKLIQILNKDGEGIKNFSILFKNHSLRNFLSNSTLNNDREVCRESLKCDLLAFYGAGREVREDVDFLKSVAHESCGCAYQYCRGEARKDVGLARVYIKEMFLSPYTNSEDFDHFFFTTAAFDEAWESLLSDTPASTRYRGDVVEKLKQQADNSSDQEQIAKIDSKIEKINKLVELKREKDKAFKKEQIAIVRKKFDEFM